MFKKFEGPFWYGYIGWSNVIDAINTCNLQVNSSQSLLEGIWGTPDRECWIQLDCALSAADASQQAQYSSSSTILGLLPTVLSIMSTSTRELILIYHRYLFLAFLLAICNLSTVLSGLNSIQDPKSVQNARHMLQSKPSEGYQIMIDRFFTIRLRGSDKKFKTPDFLYDLVLHLITICIAAIIIWQTVLLGIRGVIVFACWTWHEPFTWVGVGVLNHLLPTIAWRFCLGPINSSQPWPRWRWILCRSGGNLTLAHPRLARCFDMLFQILGLMNNGYGTAMLSGKTLVAPPMALQVARFRGCRPEMPTVVPAEQ